MPDDGLAGLEGRLSWLPVVGRQGRVEWSAGWAGWLVDRVGWLTGSRSHCGLAGRVGWQAG